MKDVTLERARTAKLLTAAGWKQPDIARQLKCTTRTVRRLISYELPEGEDALGLDCPSRDEYVQRAWPIALKLLDVVEEAIASGKLDGKSAAVTSAILVDKIKQISPPPAKVSQSEQITFKLVCNDDMPIAFPSTDEEEDSQ